MDLNTISIYKCNNDSRIFLLNKDYEGITLSTNWRGILKIENHRPFSRSKNNRLELKKCHYFNAEEVRLIQRQFNVFASKTEDFINKHKYQNLYIVNLPKINKYQIIYGNKTFVFKDKSGFESWSETSETITLEEIKNKVNYGDYSFDFTFDEISFIKKNRKFKELDENIYDFLENDMKKNPLYNTENNDIDILNYQFYQPIKEFKLYKMRDNIYLLDISLNGYFLHVNGISPFSAHNKSISTKEFIEIKEFFFSPLQKESFKLYFNNEDISTFIETYRYKNIYFGSLKTENSKIMYINGKALDITNSTELDDREYYLSYFKENNYNIEDINLEITNKELVFIKKYTIENQFDYFLELRREKISSTYIEYRIENSFIITENESINIHSIQAMSYKDGEITFILNNGGELSLSLSKETFVELRKIHIEDHSL